MRVSLLNATLADLGKGEVIAVRCGFCGRIRQFRTSDLMQAMKSTDKITSIGRRARCIRCGQRTGNAAVSIVPSRG